MDLAVFDLDGTLIGGNSFHLWLRYLIRWAFPGRPGILLKVLWWMGLRGLGRIDHWTLKQQVIRLSEGLSQQTVQNFCQLLHRHLRPEVQKALETYQQQSVPTYLNTAAPELYARLFGQQLGFSGVFATSLDSENTGQEKVHRMASLLKPGLKFSLYTDHHDDLPLMKLASEMYLVEPTAKTLETLRFQGVEPTQVISDSRLRSLFLLPNLTGGGAERVTLTLLSHLANLHHTGLYLIANEGSFWGKQPGNIRVVSSNSSSRPLARFFALLKFIWLSRDYQLLIGALELQTFWMVALAGRLWHKPTVGWLHKDLQYFLANAAPWKRNLYRWIARASFKGLDRVVVLGQNSTASALAEFPELQGKLQIINNPIDLGRIQKAAQQAPAIEVNPPFILAVGRLEWEKGFELLLQAQAKLFEQGIRLPLVILGEGSKRTELEAQVRTLGLEGHVSMPGFVDPFPILSKAEVFVLSSRTEAFPMALLEAMALEVPIVAFNCPSGPREMLESGKLGYLANPEDINDLAAGIRQMLSDPAYRAQTLEAADGKIKQFSAEEIAAQWHHMMQELLKKPKSVI